MIDLICKFLGVNQPSDFSQQGGKIVEVYAWLLLSYWLVKQQRHAEAVQVSTRALEICSVAHHRCLDPLQSKLFSYLALGQEKLGNLVDLRHTLMLALRTTSLRHDYESNAVVYNWILRSYVMEEQHDLAGKFVERSPFPTGASGAQACRFHFYMARVEAVRTDYEAAREHLSQAIRKAPHVEAVTGLLQAAHKLHVVIQLLLGDIPERSLFAQLRRPA